MYLVSRDLSIIKTLTALAVEEDGFIAEDAAYELIHCWFFKFAAILLSVATKARWTFNFFCQEITNIWHELKSPREIPMEPSSPQSMRSGMH